MAAQIFTAFIIAAWLPLALEGLGSLVDRSSGSGPTLRFSSKIALGLAACVFSLGFLSLLSIDIHVGFLFLMAVGTLGFAREAAMVHDRKRFLYTSAAAAAISLVSFIALGKTLLFNSTDDVTGYLPVVQNIRENAKLTLDPFNQNRLAVGLPGSLLMQAVAAQLFGSLNYVNFFEHVIPLVAIVLRFLERPVSLLNTIAVACMFGVLVGGEPSAFFGYTLSSNLLVAMFLIVFADQYRGLLDRVIAGADRRELFKPLIHVSFAAAACLAAKGTSVFFLAAIVLWHYEIFIAAIAQSKIAPTLLSNVAIAGIVLLVLLPLFAQQYLSSGTPYFPFTGTGYYLSSYVDVPFATSGWIPRLSLAVEAALTFKPLLFLYAFAAIVTFPVGRPLTPWLVAFATTVCVGTLLTAASGYPNNGLRYVYPLALCLIASKILTRDESPRLLFGRLFTVGLLVLGLNLQSGFAKLGERVASNLVYLLTDDFDRASKMAKRVTGDTFYNLESKTDRATARDIQGRIPAGASTLVAMADPTLLDYRRNAILSTGNCPGLSSPPPGLPLFDTQEDMAPYLARAGVQYAIIEYANVTDNENFERWSHMQPPWIRMCGLSTLAFRKKIMTAGVAIYEDSRFRVVRFSDQ